MSLFFRNAKHLLKQRYIKEASQGVNQELEVQTKLGKWVDAPILSFGKQKLVRLFISRCGIKKEILTTANHRWFAKDKSKSIHFYCGSNN